MTLQRTPNGWSCLPAAFATVFGLTLAETLRRVGHDGSEIVFPELQDPERRRAFHPQELIDVGEALGLCVTAIEGRPSSKPNGVFHPAYEVPLDVYPRFQNYLEGQVGVLTGRNHRNRPHAVVWDGLENIYDPATGDRSGVHLFQPEIFWRVTRRGSAVSLDVGGPS